MSASGTTDTGAPLQPDGRGAGVLARTWLSSLTRWVALGALVGAPTLGAGGRLAMYGFARLTGRPPLVTVRGSATVVFAGAVAGAVGALLYGAVGARWLLPRAPAAGRGLLFGALLLALYSPGIRPPWPLTFALFAPAFVAYGLLLCAVWRRLVPPTLPD